MNKTLLLLMVALVGLWSLGCGSSDVKDIPEVTEENLALLQKMCEITEKTELFQSAVMKVRASALSSFITSAIFLALFSFFWKVSKLFWARRQDEWHEAKKGFFQRDEDPDWELIGFWALWRALPIAGLVITGCSFISAVGSALTNMFASDYYAYVELLSTFLKKG